jgi:hypothetical protein
VQSREVILILQSIQTTTQERLIKSLFAPSGKVPIICGFFIKTRVVLNKVSEKCVYFRNILGIWRNNGGQVPTVTCNVASYCANTPEDSKIFWNPCTNAAIELPDHLVPSSITLYKLPTWIPRIAS